MRDSKIKEMDLDDSICWYSASDVARWPEERYNHINFERWSRDRSAPRVRIAPEALRKIDFERDTNALVKIDDMHWLVVQSKTHPARFVVDRKVGIGDLAIQISPRVLQLVRNKDCYILETEKWRAGVYVPRNELVQADVRMIPPEQKMEPDTVVNQKDGNQSAEL